MEVFHQLVAEARYREARGILETETDIPPDVAQKWQHWLDKLHQEDRLQAGVMADSKKRDPDLALDHLSKMTSGMLATLVVAVLVWVVVSRIFAFETSSVPVGSAFLLFGLVGGYLGWQRTARLISHQNGFALGVVISLGLFAYMMTSGIPLWYFYEPPLGYLLAGFLLVLPAVAYPAYRLGEYVGLGLVRVARRLTGQQSESPN
jgi:hypothetical protein